jgi:uncharacterized protein YbjT (DUF2867 family)
MSASALPSALVLGATGLVGGYCLQHIMASGLYEKLHILTRRELLLPQNGTTHIVQHIGSLDDMDKMHEAFRVRDVFCALGTTIRIAGSQEAFRTVDYEYVVQASICAARQGAQQMLVVSALGADPQSSVFYSRVKGEMERDIQKAGLLATHCFRPSFIEGNRTESRLGEKLGIGLTKFLSPLLIGMLRKYRVIHAETIARAMLRTAQRGDTGHHIIESDVIERLGIM